MFVVVVVGHRREETFSAPAAVAAETCRIIQVGKCDKQVSIRALFAIDGRGRGENIGAGEENNATKGWTGDSTRQVTWRRADGMADSEGGSEQDDVSFLRTVSISFPFFLSSFVGYGMEIFLPLIFMVIFMV